MEGTLSRRGPNGAEGELGNTTLSVSLVSSTLSAAKRKPLWMDEVYLVCYSEKDPHRKREAHRSGRLFRFDC